MPPDAELRIGPARPQTALESLALVFGDLHEADRHLEVQSLLVDEIPHEGILEARRGARLVGAVVSIAQPGRIGLVWPPKLIEDEPEATADRLLEAADARMAAAGLSMAQAVLETVSEVENRLLRAHGYQPMSRVLYLVAAEQDFPPARPEGPLDFEPYCQTSHGRLVKIVEATYEQTQDCPQLGGVREVEDVLAGYRHAGVFDPRHWLIVRHQGEDVGCLVVADHPDHESCELVYMGLAVAARGRGWGKQIARYAQWLTACAGQPRLVVAVDAANDPAIAVYTSIGFHAWDRRVVYVKLFQPQ